MFKHHNVLGLCLTLAVLFLFSQAANSQGLSPNIVACEGIGPLVGCTPNNPQGFPGFNPFVIVKLDDFGGDDPLFTITSSQSNMFGDTAIDLTMDQLVSANDLDGAGFRLINLVTAPPGSTIAPIEPGDIEFLGDWTSEPSSIPFVTGDEPSPAATDSDHLVAFVRNTRDN